MGMLVWPGAMVTVFALLPFSGLRGLGWEVWLSGAAGSGRCSGSGATVGGDCLVLLPHKAETLEYLFFIN